MIKKEKLNGKTFALAAAKTAIGRHCTETVVLDLEGKSPATDYFVVATGTSGQQIRAVADEICEFGKKSTSRRKRLMVPRLLLLRTTSNLELQWW